MQPWMKWALLAGAGAFLLIVLYVIYRGLRSPIRPWLIFRTGWAASLRTVTAAPRATLAIGFVIATGAALQLLSTAYPIFSERTFVIASIAWQAVMATCIAALATFVHLFVIHDLLAERRFGAETHFYRGPLLNQSLRARPPSLGFLLHAALLGFAIWLVTYGLQVATNLSTIMAPQRIHVASPETVRLIVYSLASFLSFLITTSLSLIRPALSLGLRRPTLSAIATAIGRAPALYWLTLLLFIAPALIGWLTVFIPHQFMPNSMVGRIIGAVLFLIFSVFQTLAVEISTVLFMNRAKNQAAPDEQVSPAKAESAARSDG